MKSSGVAVVCEINGNGKLKNVTCELLTIGRKIADSLNSVLTAVSSTDLSESEIRNLSEYGAEKIYLTDTDKQSDIFFLESNSYIVSELIRKLKPDVVLFGATDYGRVLAPKVAASLNCGITADCTEFCINEKGKLIQIRPALGGNILAHIVSESKMPQIASVRPNVFKMERNQKDLTDIVKLNITVPEERRKIKVLSRCSLNSMEFEKIENSKIIVAIGNGVKSLEIIDKIDCFAKMIGGVVACSRKIVEAGILNHSRQVGQSGKTVSPDVYFALGISGAVQHLSGMKTSSKIIAVNNNPESEIFSISHIGFVMDVEQWIEKAVKYFS